MAGTIFIYLFIYLLIYNKVRLYLSFQNENFSIKI